MDAVALLRALIGRRGCRRTWSDEGVGFVGLVPFALGLRGMIGAIRLRGDADPPSPAVPGRFLARLAQEGHPGGGAVGPLDRTGGVHGDWRAFIVIESGVVGRIFGQPTRTGQTLDRHRLTGGFQSIAFYRYHRDVAMDCSADLSPAVALFRSLGDSTRLAILTRLASGEARVVDLTAALGLAQSTVSKHLSCLRDCGLVDYRAEGRQSFYALTRPELMDLLRSAESVLAATGEAVALCPTYGTAVRTSEAS
jgi:DNA-binding transcriptional ArsR family regulator